MKRRNFLGALAVLLALLLPVTVMAAESGSLRIVELENSVMLYRVADARGVLAEEFSGAGVADVTDPAAAVENARKMADFAADRNIPGTEGTPDEDGIVYYPALEEGLYLVRSLAAEAEFKPFLAAIPTVINNETIYDVTADPKGEETEPTEPTETQPTEPEETTRPTVPGPSEPTEPGPNIPQTGNSVIPKYLLLGAGCLAVLLGLVDLVRGRRKQA